MTDDSRLVRELVQRVAKTTGWDVNDLPPLHDTIDPAAVEAIGDCDSARLRFVYVEHTVTVEVRAPGDWCVTVHRSHEESK